MNLVVTDVAIIGAGTAGLSAYRRVRAAGKRAVLIEDGPYGTTCARVGCMPSKLLIAAAEAAHTAAHAGAFGVHIDGLLRVDGEQVMGRVRSERDRFVGFVLESVENIPVEDRLHGHARFVSDTSLMVGSDTRIDATSIIIATGSSPFIPEDYLALGNRLVVNDDVFDWDTLPESVAVVGAGVIGLEIGQALARLGVRVTVINRGDRVAGLSDPQVNAAAVAAFAAELDLQQNAVVDSVALNGDQARLVWRSGDGAPVTRDFQYVLMAAGRVPNVGELDLQNTSATLDARGIPEFSRDTLQVGNTPIFIAGDANAAWPLLHEAADDGQIAGENAAAFPDVRAGLRRAPMAVVFTDPQVARVGPSFRHLPQRGVVCGHVSFANQGRARVMLKNQGLLRVYANVADGRFLGAEMAGPSMEHIAHLLAWSLQQKLTIAAMLDMPFYHPVVEEGLRTALREAARNLAEARLDCVRCGEEQVNSL